MLTQTSVTRLDSGIALSVLPLACVLVFCCGVLGVLVGRFLVRREGKAGQSINIDREGDL